MNRLVENYRLLLLCAGALLIPLFYLPVTPEDPFLIPKGILFSFIALAALIVIHIPKDEPLMKLNPSSLLLALFLFSIAVSIPGSVNFYAGLDELKRWVYLSILFLTAARMRWTLLRIRILFMAAMAGSTIVAASAILEYFELVPFSHYPFKEGQLYSFFGYQNIMAQYLVITVLWGTGLALSIKKRLIRIVAFIFTFFSGIALFATFSRGGILSAAIGISILYFLFYKNKSNYLSKLIRSKPVLILILLSLITVITVTLVFFSTDISDVKTFRLFSYMFERGDSYRITLWKDSISMFLDHPLRGVGLGNYSIIFPLYMSGSWPWLRQYAHNGLLHMAAETGIAGLSVFCLFLFTAFRRSLKACISCEDLELKPLQSALFTGCVATLLHSFVSYNFHSSASSYLFFISLGVLCAKPSETGLKLSSDNRNKKYYFLPFLVVIPMFIYGIAIESRKAMAHYHYSKAIVYFTGKNDTDGITNTLRAIKYWPYTPKYYFLAYRYYKGKWNNEELSNKYLKKAIELSPHTYRRFIADSRAEP